MYKHSTTSLYLFADERNNENWHINSATTRNLYWAEKSSKLPLQEGRFFIGGTNPPEKSKLVIICGNSTGKNHK